jgi:hypothetical protein
MTPSRQGYFDHIAVAVERWSDGYPLFVAELGGCWVGGGDAGEFAPAQIRFAGGVKVELLAPGSIADGFVARYLEKIGPAPHHLTFMVPDLGQFNRIAERYGLPLLGAFLDIPGRGETFVHPKGSGFGTLLQAMEIHELAAAVDAPAGFPPSGSVLHHLEWVAVRVDDIDRAAAFLVEATNASKNQMDSPPRSVLLEWEGDRRLLLLDGSRGGAGVDHIAFSTEEASPLSPRLALTEGRDNQIVEGPGIQILVYQ